MIGQRLSHFEITAKLGEGGMGAVYRARDTRLDREVAIKVLPSAFTEDPERLARFEREAKILASLNHPHIAALYEVGAEESIHFLVMELVEGEDLAERLARGRVEGTLALSIARQIAEALEAAHERGIVHRDLKPANVKVVFEPTGPVVKVLDFGLAKSWESHEQTSADLTRSPTMTAPMTEAGVILGTAAYMSPEQANGEVTDKRSDIWSFGALLWELLTGERLFAGRSLPDTLAAVLRDPIDLDVLPEGTPKTVRVLLARCLDRERGSRLRDIGEARIALAAATSQTSPSPLLEPTHDGNSVAFDRLRRWAIASAFVLVALVAGLYWGRSREAPTIAATRLVVTLPSAQELFIGARGYPLALSPDGSHIAYVASEADRNGLYLRRRDSFDATLVPESDGAQYPFFSPDGEWVAFFADGSLLKASVDGGTPITLAQTEVLRGGTWSGSGYIYYSRPLPGAPEQLYPPPPLPSGDIPPASPALEGAASALHRVPENGGPPEPVAVDHPDLVNRDHAWPYALPDGSGLITSVHDRLALLSFDTGEWAILGGGWQAQYVDPGFLLFHVGRGRIRAVRFDLDEHRMAGEPRPVLDGVYRAPNGGGAYYAASPGGHMIHVPGGTDRELLRVNRTGHATPLATTRKGYRLPALSPDGRKLAVTVDPRPSEVWIHDLERGTETRLSRGRDHSLRPTFSPDGRSVAFTSGTAIVVSPIDGSKEPTLLIDHDRPAYPSGFSPDGRSFVFHVNQPTSEFDLWVRPDGGDPHQLFESLGDEYDAEISADGAWIAYHSDESGRFEVYLRRFPDGGGKQPVSSEGGFQPAWRADGRELFFSHRKAVWAVDTRLGSGSAEVGQPKKLFDWPHGLIHGFAASPDGQWFVLVRTDPDSAPDRFRVVLDWNRELLELFEDPH